jgi:putative transposase
MSCKGNCCDNASKEAFWSTLQHALVYRTDFLTHDEASPRIFEYIDGLYGTRRLHWSIGSLSPSDFEATF